MGAFAVSSPRPSMQMPHVRRFFFPVSDFLAGARSAVAWTDARALHALDTLAAQYPAPFTVSCAFRRWPDARRNHGLCFSLHTDCPSHLRACALESGLFQTVSPPFLGGSTVTLTASCIPGDRAGVHILALQDALLGQGLFAGPLSGTLCAETQRALKRLTNRTQGAKI